MSAPGALWSTVREGAVLPQLRRLAANVENSSLSVPSASPTQTPCCCCCCRCAAGEWKGDKRHGQGTCKFASGRKFRGERGGAATYEDWGQNRKGGVCAPTRRIGLQTTLYPPLPRPLPPLHLLLLPSAPALRRVGGRRVGAVHRRPRAQPGGRPGGDACCGGAAGGARHRGGCWRWAAGLGRQESVRSCKAFVLCQITWCFVNPRVGLPQWGGALRCCRARHAPLRP